LQVFLSALRGQTLQRFAVRLCHLLWSTQRLAGKVYSTLLQIAPVISRAINRVTQYALRIVPIAGTVRFYLAWQISAFMKRIPAQMIHSRQTFCAQTHTELRAKLHRLVLFTTYNGTHIRLTDTDNATITASALGPIHLPLLRINMLEHP